ncbi:MAG TPA: HEPN domain-containing protein [Candidatus Mediterraneibacter stercoripullorum]|nr:HEPN domain-containing protein [Candidatus Mediterraneibacter stercoripullorum]
MRYISGDMGIDIPEETETALDRIDGFYFTTRYPGDESFIPSEKDIDKADKAVRLCRDFVLRTVSEIEQK